jgi:hypothetical protein
MPLLAYCILLDSGAISFPTQGVLASKPESIAESGLFALCSELEPAAISPGNFQQAALEFHHVIQSTLAQSAVIPFRFPTWLSADEVKAHLRQQSPRYRDFLIRHADHVQMEVRITNPDTSTPEARSGAEHLRARAAQLRSVREHAKQVKQQLADTVIEWRERETGDGMRLYALISSKSVEWFREKLNRISVRASGPWPATEFFEPHSAKD